jgi:hypothetical protein
MKARIQIGTDEQIAKLYAKVTAKTLRGEIPRERTDKVLKWVSLFTDESDDLMRITVINCLLRNRDFPEAVADRINSIVCFEDLDEEIADWKKYGADEALIKMIRKRGRRA